MQYGDFIFCAMDQVVNQAAKMRYMSGGQVSVPLVIRVPTGASTRGAQHAQSPESFFIHVPGIKIVAPSNAYDAKGLLKAAIDDDNPVLFFEHKRIVGTRGVRKDVGGINVDASAEVPEESYSIPIGKGKVVREGKDVTIVAALLMLHRSLAAAEALAREGISVEVIDPRSLLPLDKGLILNSVRKTSRLVIVEESPLTGGWGGELAAIVAGEALECLDAPIVRVAATDTPIPFSPVMEEFVVPSVERIVKGMESVLG